MNNIKTFEVKKYSINNYKNDPRFLMMTAYICCSNRRANDSIFTDDAIENSKESFINMPVVGKFEQYNQDFKSHEMNIQMDKETGKQYINYLEIPIGLIAESSNLRIVPDEIDPNQKWLVADILIWKERNYEISKLIARRQNIGVSMEVSFDDFERDESKKVDVVKRFTALALTFLGKRVIPAFRTSVAKLESFSEFKQAFCFALNEENLKENKLNESNLSEEKTSDFFNYSESEVKMDEKKAMEMTPEGYSFIGYSDKAVYAIKDDKTFAIPYEIVEDNIKMSEQSYEASLYAKEEIYAKFSVEKMSEEQKMTGVMANIDTVKVEGRSTEKFAAIEKEKADMNSKYEEINSKYESVNKEKDEAVKDKDDAVKEKEETAKKYEEMCGKYSDLEKKNKEMSEQLSKYQEEKFSTNIATVMAQYALKDSEIKDWDKKSTNYSDTESFEKDLIFYMVSTYGSVKKVENTNKVVNFGLNKSSLNLPKNNINKTNNDPLDSLREKYGING